MELRATAYSVDSGIATIMLSRPHRHNAWTGRMHTEYRHLLNEAEHDHDVRSIIVTGDPAGKAFCVGGDSEALATHVEKGGYDPGTPDPLAEPGFGVAPEFDNMFVHQFGMTKPIIAAVNGSAAGVGLAVACFADMRFLATDATYTCAHGRIGLAAEYGLAWQLPRLIGLTNATDLLVSSRKFGGDEAATAGLATGVAPKGEVLSAARTYARELGANTSRASVAETKRLLYMDLHRSAAEAVADANVVLDNLTRDPDYAEGISALREGRPPEFS